MRFHLLLAVLLLWGAGAALAQAPFESESFIATEFQIQSSYSRVLCVSQDNTCPAQVEVNPPCLAEACTLSLQIYPVSQTFPTLQAAADAAQAGDLIIITDGRYAGVEIEGTGGQDGAYIHFLGWGENVVIDSPADPSKAYLRHHFYFINAHHYILQNLKFENAERGAGIFISGYFSETSAFSHHFIISDVYSHDNGVWGLHSTSTSSLLIQDSVFSNSSEEHGAYISGSGDRMLIRRNVFQGNYASGLQVNADPQSATAEVFYWLQNFTGNTCEWSEEDVEFTGAATWHDLKACYDSQNLPDFGAFFEDGISEALIIEDNIITGNGEGGGAGINLATVRNSSIRNNVIYGNFAAGIACWDNAYAEEKGLQSYDFACQNLQITQNILVDEGGNRGALILSTGANQIQVQGNIILRDRYDAYEISAGAGAAFASGQNIYTALYTEDAPAFGGEVGSRQVSLADGLALFENPSFEPWIIHSGEGYSLNPNRPDYRLRAD